jgi:hypothetical protein
MSKQSKPIWITEAEATALAGFQNEKIFRRRVQDGTLQIGYTRLSQKASVFYNKLDIERLLLERSILPAA